MFRVNLRLTVFGLQSGFEKCYDQCLRYSNKFLDEVVGTVSDVPATSSL